MNALEILKKTRAQLKDHHEFAQMYDEAIAELETLKTCKTCSKYTPWKCTDESVLSVGDCSYGIRYGKELIDEQYEWFVPYDFGCNEYTKKDTE